MVCFQKRLASSIETRSCIAQLRVCIIFQYAVRRNHFIAYPCSEARLPAHCDVSAFVVSTHQATKY